MSSVRGSSSLSSRGHHKPRLRISPRTILGLCILLGCWYPYWMYHHHQPQQQHVLGEPPSTIDRPETVPRPPRKPSETPPKAEKNQNQHQPNQSQQRKQQKQQKQRGDITRPASNTDGWGFVHMGKTGGSTISKLLRNGCHSFVKKPCHTVANETEISKKVSHYYHVPDFQHLSKSPHPAYLWSVRDVYDRAISSFVYHHPKNLAFYNTTIPKQQAENGKIAYTCFPDVETLAGLLEGLEDATGNCGFPHPIPVGSECAKMACAALHGEIRFFVHLFFNYRTIASRIPTSPRRKLYLIRQEHLWEDWHALDRSLGGAGAEDAAMGAAFAERNLTGVVVPVTRAVSPEGRARLCRVLRDEYTIYFRVLAAAENLGPAALEDAASVADRNCPGLGVRALVEEAIQRQQQQQQREKA